MKNFLAINLVNLPELSDLTVYQIQRLNSLYFMIRTLPVSCLSQSYNAIEDAHTDIKDKFICNVRKQYAYQVKVVYDWALMRKHTVTNKNLVESINDGKSIYINSFIRVD